MFLSLIQNRRSIRKYLKKAIEPEKIDLLIEAALRSPSSRDIKPWEFIVISQPELLDKLSQAKQHGASFLKNAPLGIVICADPNRSDVWIEDVSIVVTYIQLVAESLGLGSCWIQIRERMHNTSKTAEGFIRELLSIPENLKVEAIIAVGYPDEKLPPHKREELQYEKVYYNKYSTKK